MDPPAVASAAARADVGDELAVSGVAMWMGANGRLGLVRPAKAMLCEGEDPTSNPETIGKEEEGGGSPTMATARTSAA